MEHTDQRFWQALRNWADVDAILKADIVMGPDVEFRNLRDTFYEES